MTTRMAWACLVLVACACGGAEDPPPSELQVPQAASPAALGAASIDAPLRFVGGTTCAECHVEQSERWRGSHHDLALQEPSEASVLGRFDAAQLTHFGVTTTFTRRGDAFVVHTDGPDGALRDYEVAYTFGVDPLQQLLIRTAGGRLQALGIAWDARPEARGGQRWFHLHPDEEIPHGDLLHWTGPNQSWNSMCAECHSTGLAKAYRPETDSYETEWAELDVSCEACHGPGSAHLAWARSGADASLADRGLALDLRDEAEWIFDEGAAIARRSAPRGSQTELDVCAACHARRAPLRDERVRTRPFLDAYRPALLDQSLYYPDGQILDEVYVWGSFLQSPMHAAGVTCSDCHDPHALAIQEPDAVCAGCHRSEVFATPEHHHHADASAGASCVGCHMPTRTYMQVDPRHDHSFRVPRPDLSETIGTPNACSGCHEGRDATWARQQVERWWPDGRSGTPHWGSVLHAGRGRDPEVARALAELSARESAPAIVRATALRLLREQGVPGAAPVVAAALRDASPLVRLAALEASESLDPRVQLPMARPLLRDPMLAVRVQAASSLAHVPPEVWPPGSRAVFADAISEHRAAQLVNAERPDARLNLAAIHAQFGELGAARRELETALQLAPWFVPAWVNLADVNRAEGREDLAESALRQAVELAPERADTRHALGLALVRQKRLGEAVDELQRAAELAPQVPRFVYVYGVALHGSGQPERALAVLAEGQRRHPENAELLLGLATISRDAGDVSAALGYARALARIAPDDPGIRGLVDELERSPSAP